MNIETLIRQICREEIVAANQGRYGAPMPTSPVLIRHKANFERPHQLSKACGVPLDTIRRYESGRWSHDREETRANWRKIAAVCGTTYEAYRDACFAIKGRAS